MIPDYELVESCGNCAFVNDEDETELTCNQHQDEEVLLYGKCPQYERKGIFFLVTELNPRQTMDRYMERILKTSLFHEKHPQITTKQHRETATEHAQIYVQCYLRAKRLWEKKTSWWKNRKEERA